MKRASLLSPVSILAVVLSLLAAVGDSRADTITWTNLSGGNWSRAANWDPNHVPSANDTTLITRAGTYTVKLDISVTVSNLTLGGDSGAQTLAMTGATVTISGLGTITSNGVCNLADGALNGNGPLTVDGTFNWSGGALGIEVDITSPGQLTTSGTGTRFFAGSSFNNAGTVDAQSGTLSILSVGTNSGVFNAESNAVIQFSGPGTPLLRAFSFLSGSSFTGPGLKRLIGFYITLNGTLFAQNLDLAGATLLGECTLTEGPILWTGGGIMGTLSIPTNVVLTIAGNVGIGSGQFNNAGRVIWTGPSPFGFGFGGFGGAFNNSGTFDIQNDSTFFSNGGNAGIINNTGLFRKLAGTNTTTVQAGIALNNSGLVDVESGTLNVSTFGTNSGTFNAGNNAVILFSQPRILNAFYLDTNGTFNAASNGLIVLGGGFSGSGTAFTGPGVKRFISGQLFGRIVAQNIEVAGELSSYPFEVVGGLGGNCTLTEGPILWTGGRIGGFAIDYTVSTDSNVLLFISGTNNLAVGHFNNKGTAYWMSSGMLEPDYGARFDNAGTLVVRSNMIVKGSDSWFFNSGLLLNEGGSNTISFESHVAFLNSGTVDVGSGTLLDFSLPYFSQTAGLLRLRGGNVVGAVKIQGGKLAGYGTIAGGVINGGAVAPIGALTIIGTYTQTGELDIDLGGLAPGVDYDQLIVTGRASLRGILRVALNNGFMPALGDNFSVLSFGSRIGRFDCLIGANLGGGTKLLANYSPTNVLLMTTNGPVQTNTMTIFTCGGHPPHLQFTGLPGQTYSIEATTNVVTVTNCVPDPCQILSRFDNWVTLFRTNSPTGEIDFDDPAAASLDHRFYRARLEP